MKKSNRTFNKLKNKNAKFLCKKCGKTFELPISRKNYQNIQFEGSEHLEHKILSKFNKFEKFSFYNNICVNCQ